MGYYIIHEGLLPVVKRQEGPYKDKYFNHTQGIQCLSSTTSATDLDFMSPRQTVQNKPCIRRFPDVQSVPFCLPSSNRTLL